MRSPNRAVCACGLPSPTYRARIARSARRPCGVTRRAARLAQTAPTTAPASSANGTDTPAASPPPPDTARVKSVSGSDSTNSTPHTAACTTPHSRTPRPRPGAASSPRAASPSPTSCTAGSRMAAYRTWYSQPDGACPTARSTACWAGSGAGAPGRAWTMPGPPAVRRPSPRSATSAVSTTPPGPPVRNAASDRSSSLGSPPPVRGRVRRSAHTSSTLETATGSQTRAEPFTPPSP
ncbi:hypothetical protein GCM10009731_08920 [Streptomyces globosus]